MPYRGAIDALLRCDRIPISKAGSMMGKRKGGGEDVNHSDTDDYVKCQKQRVFAGKEYVGGKNRLFFEGVCQDYW